jgi:hypothetical protein
VTVCQVAARSTALHAFESQFFRSMVSNLRKAESFFFERVTSLRRDIHVVVTTRDAAAARQLKVVTPNRFPVFFLLLCEPGAFVVFVQALQRRASQPRPESLGLLRR